MLRKSCVHLLLWTCCCQQSAGRREDAAASPSGAEGESDIVPLGAHRLRALHQKLDADGDGKATREEILEFAQVTSRSMARSEAQALLSERDADRSGGLSPEEFHGPEPEEEVLSEVDPAHSRAIQHAQFRAADKSGDGNLQEDELVNVLHGEEDDILEVTIQDHMQRLDLDQDGLLTKKEFWSRSEQEDDEVEAIHQAAHEEFGHLDVDGDGRLNPQELSAWLSGRFHVEDAMRQVFRLADTDKDAGLSATELAAAAAGIATEDEAHYLLQDWLEHHEL